MHKYVAFISYRHGGEDGSTAAWLHRAIERYRLPRSVRTRLGIGPRLGRVFRDEDELPTSASLNEQIERALGESATLIVIASPRLPESLWCRREIELFAAGRPDPRILTVMIAGDPSKRGTPEDPFPVELRRACANAGSKSRSSPGSDAIAEGEPIAADLRPLVGANPRVTRRRALLKVVAGLIGCDFDDLWARDRRRRRRRTAAAIAGLFAVLIATAIPTVLFFKSRAEVDLERRRTEEQTRLFEAEQKLKEAQALLAAQEADRAERERVRAEKESLNRKWAQYVADMQGIPVAWQGNDLLKVRQLLDRNKPGGIGSLAGPEWHYWDQRLRSPSDAGVVSFSAPKPVDAIAISPDGSLVAIVLDQTLIVREVAADAERFRAPVALAVAVDGWTFNDFDARIAFSRDGSMIAVAERPGGQRPDADGAVRVLDAATGDVRLAQRSDSIGGCAVAFSPRADHLIAGGRGTAWLSWRLDTGEPGPASPESTPDPRFPASPRAHDAKASPVVDLRFVGTRIVSGSPTSGSRVTQWSTSSRGRSDEGEEVAPGAFALPRSGSRDSPVIRRTGRGFEAEATSPGPDISNPPRRIRVLEGSQHSECAALSDTSLITGSADGVVRAWELSGVGMSFDLQPPREWRGATAPIVRIARTAGGVAAADQTGRVYVWPSARRPARSRGLNINPEELQGMHIADAIASPFGGVIAAPTGDGGVRFVREADGSEISRCTIPGGNPSDIAFSSGGRYAAVLALNIQGASRRMLEEAARSRLTTLVEVPTGRVVTTFPPGVAAADMSFDELERFLIVREHAKAIHLHLADTGERVQTIETAMTGGIRISRTGDLLGVIGTRQWGVFSLKDRTWLRRADESARGIAFDPADTLVAVVGPSTEGNLRVIDIATGELVPTAFGSAAPEGLIFGTDGLRSFARTGGGVAIYAAISGAHLGTLPLDIPFDADVGTIESELRKRYVDPVSGP